MTWTTKTIKDAAGADVTMRVWDESGAGTGPFSFGHVLSDGAAGTLLLPNASAANQVDQTAHLAAVEISTGQVAGAFGEADTPKAADDDDEVPAIAFLKGIFGYEKLSYEQDATAYSSAGAVSVSTRAFAQVASNAATAGMRPANTTAYAANDAVSNHATAGSVVAFSFTLSEVDDLPISLESMLLDMTDTGPGTAGAIIRAWIYQTDPAASTGIVGGDNAAYSTKKGTFLGVMEGTSRAFTDGSRARLVPVVIPSIGAAGTAGTLMPTRILTLPTSGAQTVFALLQTLTIFTPSANSTVFTPSLEGFQFRA